MNLIGKKAIVTATNAELAKIGIPLDDPFKNGATCTIVDVYESNIGTVAEVDDQSHPGLNYNFSLPLNYLNIIS